jgi:hypothetical protein
MASLAEPDGNPVQSKFARRGSVANRSKRHGFDAIPTTKAGMRIGGRGTNRRFEFGCDGGLRLRVSEGADGPNGLMERSPIRIGAPR